MSGVRQKSPVLLANRRGGRGRGLAVINSVSKGHPLAPSDVRVHARTVWNKFWASRVSDAVDYDADYEALRFWVLAVDERETLSQLATSQPLIPGSRHTKERPHLILNPLFRRIRELTADIERAQEAFGMTPLSRFRLQITYADAGQSLADLRRRTDDDRRRGQKDVVDLDSLG